MKVTDPKMPWRFKFAVCVLLSLGVFVCTFGVWCASTIYIGIIRVCFGLILIWHVVKIAKAGNSNKRHVPCPFCKDGRMAIKIFHGYPIRVHRIPYAVLEANKAVCDKCGEGIVHAREYKRWQKEFYRRYSGNLVRVSGFKR